MNKTIFLAIAIFCSTYAHSQNISKNTISTSSTIWTALVPNSKLLTYNAESNVLVYIARTGGAYGGNGNQLKFMISKDLGATWVDSVVYSNTSVRYPGGAVFYEGTPSLSNTYIVGTGANPPPTQSSFIFSSKIDSTHAIDTLIALPSDLSSNSINIAQTVTTDGYLHVIAKRITTASADDGYAVYNGLWDSSNHKFVFSKPFSKISPLFSTTSPTSQPDGMAWSKDGSVGYFYINGQDSLDAKNNSAQPIVYKSTDHGDTWTKMPIPDLSQNDSIKAKLIPLMSNPAKIRPLFLYGYDNSEQCISSTVDANGNLHLAVNMVSAVSEHPDSLLATYANEPSKIFDLIYHPDNTWTAIYIDTLRTQTVQAAESKYGSGSYIVTWDHRLRITRTDDGTKVFAIWTDTDPIGYITQYNKYPDIYGKGIDLITGKTTPTLNFTKGTKEEGLNYFINVADVVETEGQTYKIPVSRINWGSNVDTYVSYAPTQPVTHQFIRGILISDSDFNTGIAAYTKLSNITISQNYPNPANGLTSIDLNLAKPSNITLSIYDLMGRELSAINYGSINTGNRTLTFDTKKLAKGMYIFTIKTDEGSVSKRFTAE